MIGQPRKTNLVYLGTTRQSPVTVAQSVKVSPIGTYETGGAQLKKLEMESDLDKKW